MIDEHREDPNFVDLLTQIMGIKIEFKKFMFELSLYRVDIDDHVMEMVNFHKGMLL